MKPKVEPINCNWAKKNTSNKKKKREKDQFFVIEP